jgi:hypothetical protein
MMRIPYLMTGCEFPGQMQHVKISADEQRLAQPPQAAASDFFDVKAFAYLRKTVARFIHGGIHGDFMALLH